MEKLVNADVLIQPIELELTSIMDQKNSQNTKRRHQRPRSPEILTNRMEEVKIEDNVMKSMVLEPPSDNNNTLTKTKG